MAQVAGAVEVLPSKGSRLDHKLSAKPSRTGAAAFLVALAAGLCYIALHVARDMETVTVTSIWPYMLLALALLIALGFEFVNGFHDTANAVATVIYTHSLEPNVAVVLSGIFNLAGVLASTGTVAFAVLTLLPVDLILQVSSGAGFAMVFALLVAAILWNLGTWWFGLPASSSHTMVGSIIGVGVANQLLRVHTGTSGVDWGQAIKVLEALLISPLVGFFCAGILLLIFKGLTDTDRARSLALFYRANYMKPIWALFSVARAGIILTIMLNLLAWLSGALYPSMWRYVRRVEGWEHSFGADSDCAFDRHRCPRCAGVLFPVRSR